MCKTSYLVAFLLLFFSAHFALSWETQSTSGSRGSFQPRPGADEQAYTPLCYPYVKEVALEDKENSSLGIIKTRHTFCRRKTSDAQVKKNFGDSKSFAEFLGSARYSHLGEANKFDVNRCGEEKDIPVHEIASKYYYIMNRIELGQQSAVSRIAAISRVQGDQSVLERTGCSKSDFPNVKKICEEAKQCSQQEKTLENMTGRTEKYLSRIGEMEKSIKKKTWDKGGQWTTAEERKNLEVEIMTLKVALDNLKSQIPWTDGVEFKNAITRKRPVGEAIVKQLEADRKSVVSQYALLNRHKRCAATGTVRGVVCDKDDIVELSKNTPSPGYANASSKDAVTNTKLSYSNKELDAQVCIFDGKINQLETSQVLNSAAGQAVLTVVTLGLSNAAILARMAASRALVTENAAANLVKAASAARIGIDGAMYIKDVAAAVTICEKFAAETPVTPKTDSCPIVSIMESSPQSDAYSDCMVAVAMAGADGGRLALGKLSSLLANRKVANLTTESQKKLATFMGAQQNGDKISTLGAASELDNLARFKAADKLLGQDLTLDQRKAVLAAHKIGGTKGYFEYTKAELRQKEEILKASGLSPEQSSLLMRKGITGQFSGDSAKLAEQGLLDSQLTQRNTQENLESYREDFKHNRSKGMAFDNQVTKAEKETNDLKAELSKPGLSELKKKEIDSIYIVFKS